MGPIPWRDVVHYAGRAGLDEEATEEFLFLIRELEKAFRRWQREEASLLQSIRDQQAKDNSEQ